MFREGEGREQNINVRKHQSVAFWRYPYCIPVGDQTHNPGMCHAQELNPWPFALWDDAQTTEPCRAGQPPALKQDSQTAKEIIRAWVEWDHLLSWYFRPSLTTVAQEVGWWPSTTSNPHLDHEKQSSQSDVRTWNSLQGLNGLSTCTVRWRISFHEKSSCILVKWQQSLKRAYSNCDLLATLVSFIGHLRLLQALWFPWATVKASSGEYKIASELHKHRLSACYWLDQTQVTY